MCAVYSFEYEKWMDDLPPFSEKIDAAAYSPWKDSPTMRPSGIGLRNVNPIIRATENGTESNTDGATQFGVQLEAGWWGYLENGEPVKWPSINARSERLLERPGGANRRVLVPATGWYEMQKPSRDWYQFSAGRGFLMAGIMQRGTPRGGTELTCYSLVMRSAIPELHSIHDRMPIVLPPDFYEQWLDPGTKGSRELIEAALDASERMLPHVRADRVARSPLARTSAPS